MVHCPNVPHCLFVEFVSVFILAVLHDHGNVELLGADRMEDEVNFLPHIFQREQATVMATWQSGESFKHPFGFFAELIFGRVASGGLNADLDSFRDVSLGDLSVEFAGEGIINLIGIENFFESLLTSLHLSHIGFDNLLITFVTKDILGLAEAVRVDVREDWTFVIAALGLLDCSCVSVNLHLGVLIKVSLDSSYSRWCKLFFDNLLLRRHHLVNTSTPLGLNLGGFLESIFLFNFDASILSDHLEVLIVELLDAHLLL
jgi:hypothetical protein